MGYRREEERRKIYDERCRKEKVQEHMLDGEGVRGDVLWNESSDIYVLLEMLMI